MNSINDGNNDDSSDSENENEDDQVQSSDDDEDLSFESDDEGNYQQNVNKKHHLVSAGSSEEEDDDEDDEIDDADIDDGSFDEDSHDEEEEEQEEQEEQEENGDDVYEDDDSDALSFEEDSENDELPSSSKNATKKTAKQNGRSAKNGEVVNSKNEKAKSQKDKPKPVANKSSEPGSLLRTKKDQTNAVEAFKNELNKSGGVAAHNGNEADEYEKHDTDDEEDIRNTVGNIPMKWYDEYKHIGYDWDAKKIIKPAKGDQLDDFLKRMEDPNFWRTVKDPQTGQDVILSDADIDLIKRINSQRIPDANFDDYAVSKNVVLFVFSFIIMSVNLTCILILIFIFCRSAMGRVVYIGSRKDANSKCARPQAFIHSIRFGEEESVEACARYQNGLAEDNRRIGKAKSQKRSTILHALGNRYGQRGNASNP